MLRPLLFLLTVTAVFGGVRAQSENGKEVSCPPQKISLPAQLLTYGDTAYFDLTEVARAATVVGTSTGSWSALRVDRKSQRYRSEIEAPAGAVERLGRLGEGLVEVCVNLSPLAGELGELQLVAPSGKTLRLLAGAIRKPRTARQICFSPLVSQSFARVKWIEDWDAKPIRWNSLAGESVAGTWTLSGLVAYGTLAPVQLSSWSIQFAKQNVDRITPLNDSIVELSVNRFAIVPEHSGSYSIDVLDPKGCRKTYVFAVNVQSNCEFNVRMASSKEPTCPQSADGQMSFIAVGAVGTPTYSLGPVSNSSGFFGQLPAGSYTLRVRGAEGCLLEKSVALAPAPAATVEYEQIAVSCDPPLYQVNILSVGATDLRSATWAADASDALAGSVDLGPGLYPLSYMDERGCVYADTLLLSPAGELAVEVLAKAPACASDGNGSIELLVSGGLAPYDAIWEDMSAGLERKYLYPGDYTGVVFDQRGCEISVSASVVAPPLLLVRHELLPPSCVGESNGVLSVSASGGTGAYTMSVNSGVFTSALSVDTLSSGLHSFTIRDEGGCEISKVVDVPMRSPLPGGSEEEDASQDPSTLAPKEWAGGHEIAATTSPETVGLWRATDGERPLSDTASLAESVLAAELHTLLLADSLHCAADTVLGADPRVRVADVFLPGAGPSEGQMLRVFGRSGTVIDRFAVYDPAGALVFEVFDFEVDAPRGWDGLHEGKPAPAGAYLYEVTARLPSGEINSARGMTTLVR